MKTILLACSAGMSTSLMVTKIQQSAKAQGHEIDIYAIPESTIDAEVSKLGADLKVLLLGPQVRFLLKQVQDNHAGKGIHIDVMDMRAYGTMNGDLIFNSIKDKL